MAKFYNKGPAIFQSPVEKTAADGGPLRCFQGNAIEAAVLISQNKTVEKVIVTHVTETSCGVWRKGKKS